MSVKQCYSCGSKEMGRVEKLLTREIAGHAFRARVPAMKCRSCGELLYTSADLGRFDDAVAVALIDAGITASDAVKFIRKAIGLPARELAALLGVRPETLSRWENGKREIDHATLALLRQLITEHRTGKTPVADLLNRLHHPTPLARTVTLKLAS
jgi:putative zinc finger/helix-turn-helix YgiT family protein